MYRITSRIIFVLMAVGLAACIPTAPPSRARLKETAAAVTVQAMVRTLAAPYTQTALYRAVIADITRTAAAAGTDTPLPETLTPPVSPVPSVVVNPGACNWAGYPIDITYPDGSEVGTGEHIRKVWRIQNLGSCTWNSAYTLVYDHGTQMGAPAYTPITTGSVPPGGTVDVAVDLIAPSSAGSYQVYFRMRAPDGSYVPIGNRSEGTLWAIITTSAPVPCNWAAFLEDINYPDGSRLNAGEEFTKTWRIQNIGTCDWTRDYRLVFVGGDRMGAADFVPITRHVVPPGRILDVSVDLKAPGTPGTYEGWFKLRAADGHVFGIGYNNAQPIWLRIVVAPTPTPTVPTPTPSMTVTPSPTLTPSSTPTPSETPTETLTPSPTNT